MPPSGSSSSDSRALQDRSTEQSRSASAPAIAGRSAKRMEEAKNARFEFQGIKRGYTAARRLKLGAPTIL